MQKCVLKVSRTRHANFFFKFFVCGLCTNCKLTATYDNVMKMELDRVTKEDL